MESPVSGPSIEDTKVDEIQQEEQIINSVQQTTDEHEDVSNTLLSGLSANNSCAPSDSSLPVQRTEKAGASFKRTPNSSKRLLAPSFFSKKS